jgi:hypothetical protein
MREGGRCEVRSLQHLSTGEKIMRKIENAYLQILATLAGA